jgi:hypothetical protein
MVDLPMTNSVELKITPISDQVGLIFNSKDRIEALDGSNAVSTELFE